MKSFYSARKISTVCKNIIKTKKINTFITRQHPRGARPLTGYPIDTEPQSGKLGYKIGYRTCGCKEPLFIRTLELNEVLEYFGYSQESHERVRVSPITKIKKRIIKALGGINPTE